MTEPTLFDPLPQEHTETQAAWAQRVLADWGGMTRAVAALLVARGSRGATPWEAVREWGWPERKIIGIRAAFTTLHQAGDIVRTKRTRDAQYVYVAPWAWTPDMGTEPSKPHHGRGSTT